jgi:hypothetical protein
MTQTTGVTVLRPLAALGKARRAIQYSTYCQGTSIRPITRTGHLHRHRSLKLRPKISRSRHQSQTRRQTRRSKSNSKSQSTLRPRDKDKENQPVCQCECPLLREVFSLAHQSALSIATRLDVALKSSSLVQTHGRRHSGRGDMVMTILATALIGLRDGAAMTGIPYISSIASLLLLTINLRGVSVRLLTRLPSIS